MQEVSQVILLSFAEVNGITICVTSVSPNLAKTSHRGLRRTKSASRISSPQQRVNECRRLKWR